MCLFEFCVALFFADLKFALLEYFQDYGLGSGFWPEAFLKVGMRCYGAFGDVGEDLLDLENFVQIGLTRTC